MSVNFQINATFSTIADFQEDASKLSSGATSLDNITSGEQDIVVCYDFCHYVIK